MPVTLEASRSPAAATATPAARWAPALLALMGVELVVLFAPTVAWLVDRWTLSVWHNAHGMFVPPLAAYLAWQELKRRPDLPAVANPWGFAILVPALALHALDAGMHTQLLSALALFLAVPGMALLFLGTARTRVIAFPIVLLLFAIPIPLAFTESVHLVLRELAASATATLLPLVGVSVFREGTTLHTISGGVLIGDACSGFSTMYAAVTAAALVAYLASSWRRRVLVLVVAAPLAIAVNIVRVIALTLMVAGGQGWLLDTFVHPLSGMMTFAVALPLLMWLGGTNKPRSTAPAVSTR